MVAEGRELALHVVRGTGHHEPEEREALLLVHPAGHAVVEEGDPAVGHDHQVAAVQVAVKDAVDHRSFEERDQHRAQHGGGIDAGRAHAVDVVVLEAVQPLHDEHASGHQRWVGTGHDDRGLARVAQDVRDVEHVLALEPEVEFLEHRLGEELDERGRVGETGDGDLADEPRRDPSHRADVAADQASDLRSLHLHDDVLAGREPRRVHLRDRSRRECLAVEEGENLFERAAEFLLDDPSHGLEGLGRHLVAAELKLLDEFVGKDALARRDDLSELDVGGPEHLEAAPQPAREAGERLREAASPLAEMPDDQRRADPAAGTDETAERRQGRRRGDQRDLVAGGATQGGGRRPPRQRRGVLDDPGAAIGEGAVAQVGRGPRGGGSGGFVRHGAISTVADPARRPSVPAVPDARPEPARGEPASRGCASRGGPQTRLQRSRSAARSKHQNAAIEPIA